MLTSPAIFEFIRRKLRSLFATKIFFVSQPFEESGSWAIVHGTADDVVLRRFKTLEEAASQFSATTIAAGMGGAVVGILICEVDVPASVRVVAK